jgi:hypothetical protein
MNHINLLCSISRILAVVGISFWEDKFIYQGNPCYKATWKNDYYLGHPGEIGSTPVKQASRLTG